MSEQPFDDPKMTDDPARQADDAAQEAETAANPEGPPSGYAPSQTEVNRSRVQGLGVGQEELNIQRDPTRRNSSEQY